MLLRLSNGATGIVSIGSFPSVAGQAHADDRLRVSGTLGSVEMRSGKVQLITEHHPPQELSLTAQGSILENFVALLRGQGSQVMTADEAFEMARLGLMARQAVEEARVIFA